MKIDTGNAAPIRSRPYRQTAEENAFLKTTVESMQKAGVVVRSEGEWAFPTFTVYKRALGKKLKQSKKRKVVDYRKLNALVAASAYPLPPLDQ
jgi:predicted neuraminidase